MDSMIYKSPDDTPLGTRGELVAKLAGFNTMPEIEGGSVLFGPGISIRLLDESNEEITSEDGLVKMVDVQCTHDLESELANLSLEQASNGKISGFVRIRSKSQGVALALGDRLTQYRT